MVEVRIKDLDLGEHEIGYTWKAGETPPQGSPLREHVVERDINSPGEWLVRKDPTCWTVLFRSSNGPEYPIHTLPHTGEGERAAKAMALKLVDIAWDKKRRR